MVDHARFAIRPRRLAVHAGIGGTARGAAQAGLSDEFVTEGAFDKGYHGRQTLLDLEEMGVRSYASEPARGRQKWGGGAEARDAVYANRRRVRGKRGKRLLRSRGEKVERTFAHCYETGGMRGMRPVHLRGRTNVAKRVLIHAAAFDVGLMMRLRYGLGKPRGSTAKAAAVCALILALMGWLQSALATTRRLGTKTAPHGAAFRTARQCRPVLLAA